ncbi:hypothetical protein Nepgr_031174 [Nepenthes gracilis]|uniref:Uncharacterized protein n=1 Tax=Nepenthes gracilis TaxID=150966 RepID=A0AAD3THZ5_NEPGR|nr:hypothetical protein Nepgr_031174 [Nepenthes gracilis]
MRGKGCVIVQFGCCYNYATNRDAHPPGLIRDEEVDSLPLMFKQIDKRMVLWHILPPSCVLTSRLVYMLAIIGPGEFSGPISISVPVGFVMIPTNIGADTAKYCDPPIPQVVLPTEAWGLIAPHNVSRDRTIRRQSGGEEAGSINMRRRSGVSDV